MRRLFGGRQRGTTLVEVLVAVPVIAMIVGGVAGMLYQTVDAHDYVTGRVQCYREVQRAGSWFSRDAVQAQAMLDENYADEGTTLIAVDQDLTVAGTEMFIVEWTDWNDDERTVLYSLVPVTGSPLFRLQRTVRVNGSTTETHTAAEHIDTSTDPDTGLNMSRFEWVSEDKEVVRMVVTATYRAESVTRFYDVRPRAMTPP